MTILRHLLLFAITISIPNTIFAMSIYRYPNATEYDQPNSTHEKKETYFVSSVTPTQSVMPYEYSSISNPSMTQTFMHLTSTSTPTSIIEHFEHNHPSKFVERLAEFGITYELDYNFDRLPKVGEPRRIPWPSTFWPTYNDSINDSVRLITIFQLSHFFLKWYQKRWADRGPSGKYAQAFGMDPDALENAISEAVGVDSYKKNTTMCFEDSDCEKGWKCGKRKRHQGKDSVAIVVEDEVGKCIPEWFGLCHAVSFHLLIIVR